VSEPPAVLDARPGWLERLIAYGDAVGDPRHLVSLEPEDLLTTARASTGLADFDDGTRDWHRHYDVLLRALEDESRLHLVGRILARTEVLRSLRNRLRLHDLWARRPAILEAAVDPPVFIVGSPRTGTSILHELLACDPATRAPAMWEMLHPVEAVEDTDLTAVADRTVTLWHDLEPAYATMHTNSGLLPNECIFITMNEFLSDHWSGCHDVPSYAAHLVASDHRGAYRLHRRVLQTLQEHRRGARWVLKAPSHLGTLPALFAVYPEARIVQIHRDPAKTLPSALSLMGTLKRMRCRDVDLRPTAARLPRAYEALFRREIEQRASGALPDARFVDLRYHDFVADPLAAVADLYARLGWELAPAARAAMAAHLARQPRGTSGPHRYDAAAFGLDPADVRERFRFYRERFGVPDEA
jgi:Sulfotransferase family